MERSDYNRLCGILTTYPGWAGSSASRNTILHSLLWGMPRADQILANIALEGSPGPVAEGAIQQLERAAAVAPGTVALRFFIERLAEKIIDYNDQDFLKELAGRLAAPPPAPVVQVPAEPSPVPAVPVPADSPSRPAAGPLHVFISYSHQDEAFKETLEKQLTQMRRGGLISIWNDRDIEAGTQWKTEIDSHLETADVILLLISPDFIASEYCYEKEMLRALERHDLGQARVIPIILRHADWHTAPFGKLQALPKDGRPIKSWADGDEAWLDVARGIRRAITSLRSTPND